MTALNLTICHFFSFPFFSFFFSPPLESRVPVPNICVSSVARYYNTINRGRSMPTGVSRDQSVLEAIYFTVLL